MRPFRDYRQVIQTAPRCRNSESCATLNQPELLDQILTSLIERSWDPAEIDMLRRAASAALL